MFYGAAHDWPQFAAAALGDGVHVLLVVGGLLLPALDLAAVPDREAGEPTLVGAVWLTVADAALGNMFVGPTLDYGASSFLVAPWWAVTEGISGGPRAAHLFSFDRQLVVRFVRGTETVRQQVFWLLVAVILVVLINVPSMFQDNVPTGRYILILLSFPLIPAAVTIAVLRHGLYDVRIVVSRLVVYALLTAGVIAVYVGVVAVLDRVLQGLGRP